MNYFKFDEEDYTISKTTFADKSLKDLMDGSYIMRLDIQGFSQIYYASTNDALWNYLKITGRITESLVTFIETCVSLLIDGGEYFDWESSSWHDLSTALVEYKKIKPDSIEVPATVKITIQKQEDVLPLVHGETKSDKFNKFFE